MLNRETGIYQTSYRADMGLHKAPLSKIGLLILALVLFWAIPVLLPLAFVSGVVCQILIYIIAAVGLNILVGYAGQVSLGQAAFMAVGGYGAGVLINQYGNIFAFNKSLPNLVGWATGDLYWVQNVFFFLDLRMWPVFLAIIMGGIISALVGLIFGIPSLRVKGLYLIMATIAAQQIIEWFLPRASFLTGVKAQQALQVRPAQFIEASTRNIDMRMYFVLLVFAILAVVFAENLMRSRVGRAFVAVRDRDIAAEIMGINLFNYKLRAFAVAAFYAGVAGALWTLFYKGVSYEQFTLVTSVQLVAMIIIGGLGSIPGAIFGAIFITFLPWFLREVALPFVRGINAGLGSWLEPRSTFIENTLFGLIIILFLIFEAEGLYKLWRNVKNYFRLWPFTY